MANLNYESTNRENSEHERKKAIKYEKAISKYKNEIDNEAFLEDGEKETLLVYLRMILAAEMGFSQRPYMPPSNAREARADFIPSESWNVQPRPQPYQRPSMPPNEIVAIRPPVNELPMGLSPMQRALMNDLPIRNTGAPSSDPGWLETLKAREPLDPLPSYIAEILQDRSARMQEASWKTPASIIPTQPVHEPIYSERYVTKINASIAFLWDMRPEVRSSSSSIQQTKSLKEVASEASNAIRNLFNDSDFQRDIKTLAEQHDQHKKEIHEELRDTEHVNKFLDVLKNTIYANRKYSDSEMKYMIDQCKDVLEDVKNGKASVRELNTSLRELALKTEIWEKELTEEIKEADEKSKKALGRLMLGSLGMFLVGVSATPATLTAVITANIGSALISRVLAEHSD